MNKHFAFFLIFLISTFSYYQFDSHTNGLQFDVEQENVTFKFTAENNELPDDDSGKQTSYAMFSHIPFVVSLIITMACLNYMLITLLWNLALLIPVRFKSNYVIVPPFS